MADTQKLFETNYQAANQPFASMEESEKALEAFFNAAYEARNNAKIPDILIVFRFTVATEQGHGDVMSISTIGNDALYGETMAAFALGHTSAHRQEFIAKLAHGKKYSERKGK